MPPVDLLAFGPHPDDLEIGMGATIAHHVAKGLRVGLCDLTRGEMGSNGTPAEREQRGRGRPRRAGRGLAGEPGAAGPAPARRRRAGAADRRAHPRGPAVGGRPAALGRPAPDHTAACALVTSAAFSSGLRRFQAAGEAWKADWLVHYFINTPGEPSFVVDVSSYYEVKQRALACHVSQFAPRGGTATRRD